MTNPRPDVPIWSYEPSRARRQRNLATIQMLRERAVPLVASGDPVDRIHAQNLVKAAAAKPQVDEQSNAIRKSMAERAKEILLEGLKSTMPILKAPEALQGLNQIHQGGLGFFTGEDPADSLRRAGRGLTGQEQFSGEDLGFVRHLPEGRPKRIAGAVGEELVDPLNIAAALVGGPGTLTALRKSGRVGSAVAAVAEPIAARSLPMRIAEQAGLGLAARGGSEAARRGAEAAGAGEGVQTAAAVAGGLAGGITGVAGIHAATAGARAARAGAPAIADAARRLAVEEGGYTKLPGHSSDLFEATLRKYKPNDARWQQVVDDYVNLPDEDPGFARAAKVIEREYVGRPQRGPSVRKTPLQRAVAKAEAEGKKIGEARRAEAEALISQQPELKGLVQVDAEGARAPTALEASQASRRKLTREETDAAIKADREALAARNAAAKPVAATTSSRTETGAKLRRKDVAGINRAVKADSPSAVSGEHRVGVYLDGQIADQVPLSDYPYRDGEVLDVYVYERVDGSPSLVKNVSAVQEGGEWRVLDDGGAAAARAHGPGAATPTSTPSGLEPSPELVRVFDEMEALREQAIANGETPRVAQQMAENALRNRPTPKFGGAPYLVEGPSYQDAELFAFRKYQQAQARHNVVTPSAKAVPLAQEPVTTPRQAGISPDADLVVRAQAPEDVKAGIAPATPQAVGAVPEVVRPSAVESPAVEPPIEVPEAVRAVEDAPPDVPAEPPIAPPAAPPGGGGGGLAATPPGSGGGPVPAPRTPGRDGIAEEIAFVEQQLAPPGQTGRFLAGEAPPGSPKWQGKVRLVIRKGAVLLNPSLDLERGVHVGYNAKVNIEAKLPTLWKASGYRVLDEIHAALAEATPTYRGEEGWHAAGTVLDMLTKPSNYEGITPRLRAALDAYRAHGDAILEEAYGRYGVDVHPFEFEDPNAVYMPTVDGSEEAAAAINRTTDQLARTGRTKARVYDAPYDRWLAAKKRGEDFTPLTDPYQLMEHHADALARMAGLEAFKEASGGKVLADVVDELYPGLRARKEKLAAVVSNLDERLRTAVRQQEVARGKSAVLGRQLDATTDRIEGIAPRVEELGDEYGPELSHLSGQLYELNLGLSRLVRAQGPEDARAGVAGTRHAALLAAYEQAARDLDDIKAEYRGARTAPYVRNASTNLYYPGELSAKVDALLPRSEPMQGFFDKMQWLRSVVLSMDASITSMHGMLGAMLDPALAYKVAGDIKRVVMDPAQMTKLAQDEAEDVGRFARSVGFEFPMRGVAQAEFRPRGVEALPVIGQKIAAVSDAQWRGIWYLLYQNWKKQRDMLLETHPGMTRELAEADAAYTLANIIPARQAARMGKTPLRQNVERSLLISPSFLEAPIVWSRDAATGMAKMLKAGKLWDPSVLTGREHIAVERMKMFMGTAVAVSAASAVISAPANHQSPEEALWEVMNPTSGRFLSIVLGNQGSIPLGGPLRSFLRALGGRYVNGEWQPFAGIVPFLKGKSHPAASALMSQVSGKDYFGNPIDEGIAPYALANRMLYGLESVSPIAGQELLGGLRTGSTAKEIVVGTLGQLAGTNVYQRRPAEDLDRIARSRYGKVFYDLDRIQQQELKEAHPGLYQRVIARSTDRRQQVDAIKRELGSQQAATDAALLSGKFTKDEWLASYFDRQVELHGRTAEAYRGTPQQDKPPRNPHESYLKVISDNADPATGRVDWDAVNEWKFAQSAEDQAYIIENTGVDRTPLARVYNKIARIRAEGNRLPKYPGYDAKEAREIDALWQKARNNAASAKEADMLRAFAKLPEEERQGKIGAGVLARIRHRLRPTKEREAFTKKHPEIQLFFGRGPLTDAQKQALERLVEAETRPGERVIDQSPNSRVR